MLDVVVAGAGIAGPAVAAHLAERGLRVLLLDRNHHPSRKACGEGIFPAGVRELAALGLAALVGQGCELRSLRFEVDGVSAAAPLALSGQCGLGLARPLLDAALLARACQAGAEYAAGVTVTGLIGDGNGRFRGVQTDSGVIEARAVVAADGLGSRLRRRAGLDRRSSVRRFGVSAHLRREGATPAQVAVHFRRGHEVYVTPVAAGVVNAALLLDAGEARGLASGLAAIYRARVESALAAPVELLDEPLAAGPFPAAAARAWRGNLVLAGDAAGFFDGVTGEGMSHALISARACADALASYLADGDERAFAAYDKQRRSLARASTLLARLTLALAKRPFAARRAVGNLARRPQAFARLVAVNTGELPLSALRPRDLLALALGL
jgi:flavin-dependent dehydrogenase